MTVGMRHQLVGLLGHRIEAQRLLGRMISLEGQHGVAAVDRTGRRIQQMLHVQPSTAFEHIEKCCEIVPDAGVRLLHGPAYSRLGCEVNHTSWCSLVEHLQSPGLLRDILSYPREVLVAFKHIEPVELDGSAVVVVDDVYTQD